VRVLLKCGSDRERQHLAYFILSQVFIAVHGKDSAIARAIGRDFKGKVSAVIYAVAILLTFVNSWLACALYVLVALTALPAAMRYADSIES
jgi:uncharacterized membrane protein